MSTGFFITGTDTGVGKTIISGALIRTLKFLGLKAGAMKPIETGCKRDRGLLVPHDALFLKQTARMEEPVTLVAPFCYESPLSPLAAAETDARALPDIGKIKDAYRELAGVYDAIVVEGAGGLMVPVKENYYMIDLAAELGLPLVVVARPGLGTINHTMLTVRRALEDGVEVAGIIINYSMLPENSLAEKTNPGLLARISAVPVIGIFPYLGDMDEDSIGETAIKHFNLDLIKKYLRD